MTRDFAFMDTEVGQGLMPLRIVLDAPSEAQPKGAVANVIDVTQTSGAQHGTATIGFAQLANPRPSAGRSQVAYVAASLITIAASVSDTAIASTASGTPSGSAVVARTPVSDESHNMKLVTTSSAVCGRIQRILDIRRPGLPVPLSLPTTAGEGRAIRYEGVDLDGDHKPDSLLQDCGSPSEGSCTLYVALASGKRYEFSERPFRVVSFEDKHYVVVGDRFPAKPKRRNRSVYLLTDQGATLTCGAI